MSNLERFFEINWVAIYFIYGQVFFVTGLVTALLSRRRSELELARSLPWLAGFGIVHGFNEWGYIFKPLQAFYLSHTLVVVSDVLHLAVLGVSFFCLLQFGVRLSNPSMRGLRPSVAPAILATWIGVLLLLSALEVLPLEQLVDIGDILSRYTMALPGSILACLGLWRKARRVDGRGMPRIARYLRAAAYTFAGYALAAGLMVPAGPFPPASWFNYDLLTSGIAVPIPVFRSLLGLAMAYTVYRSLEIFEAEREQQIAAIEKQRLLAEDRERIGRDLHDGIIQSIYASGLRLESILPTLDASPGEAREVIRSVMSGLNETIQNIRNFVFDLRRTEGQLELEAVLGELVREVQLDTYLEADYRVTGKRSCPMAADRADQLVQIARETLSNVVRHAGASHVGVDLNYEAQRVCLAISDDGIGFVDEGVSNGATNGHGLANIRKRAEVLQGNVSLHSAPGRGTTVEIVIPCDPGGGTL